MEKLCELCEAVYNSKTIDCSIFNTILYETEHFLITPCIGPLVEGQVMIVSKSHYSSLASMNEIAISECVDIFKKIFSLFKTDILLSEHGSFYQLKGGACIEHTHIHVVPQFGHLFNYLDSDNTLHIYSKVSSIDSLHLLKTIDFPYILNINNNNGVRVYEAYSVHSQMMRKVICHYLRMQNCDWRKQKNIGIVKKTITLWEHLLK
jgi:ATP adenylyltransferase